MNHIADPRVAFAGTPNILFVDDEENILSEYQEFLELKGYAAQVEVDPRRAFDTVMATPEISLVITDLRMSGLDGATLIRKLRASLPKDRHVSFLILTGDEDANPADHEPLASILHKPVDPDELLSAVKQFLTRT
jgi:two-component system response regulator FlrC